MTTPDKLQSHVWLLQASSVACSFPFGDEVTVKPTFLISPYRVLGPFHGRDGDSIFVLHCFVIVTIACLDSCGI
jgi:hypothetical protein